MPLPQDPQVARTYLLRWANGNVAAAEFVGAIADLARVIDDATDDAVYELAVNRQAAFCRVWAIALVDLAQNPFWLANAPRLALVMNETILNWQWSDELKASGDERRQTFGYVLREATDRVAIAVARIVGGHDFAAGVAREIYDVCHAPFSETVAEWVGSAS